jgi:6-phosphogluconolactonase
MKHGLEIRSFAEVSQEIVMCMQRVMTLQGTVSLAVSGGVSPIPLFQQLSHYSLPWHNVQISLVDERWVPPHHEARNERMVRNHLLQHAAGEASLVSLYLPNENQLQAVARLQSMRIDPDICMLGMGADGHTASLFPDAPEFQDALSTSQDYLILRPQHVAHPRISMSLQHILRIPKIYVLIAGEAKVKMWHQAMAHPNDPRWPISYVLARHPKAISYELQ